MIKVIIADDHKIILDGLASLLSHEANIEVFAKCIHGAEVLHQCALLEPNLVILDINMPIMGGYETLLELKKAYPQVRVLVLTTHDDGALVKKMLANGASGYLLKSSAADKLVQSIYDVANGKAVIDNELILNLAQVNEVSHEVPKLTLREKEVLELIAKGLSSNAMAEKLFLSANTILSHRKNLFEKFEVNTAIELINKAYKMGLLQ